MYFIEWHQNYEVGVVDIDVDHRKLFAVYNNFVQVILNKADKIRIYEEYNHLARCIEDHFYKEEAILKSLSCSSLAEHQETHQRLLGELIVYQKAFSAITSNALFLVFANEIRHWMLTHLLEDVDAVEGCKNTCSIQSNSAV